LQKATAWRALSTAWRLRWDNESQEQWVRAFAAMNPLRVPLWPHQGPVSIRERSDIHVVDHWQFLGTAQNEADLYDLLENHRVVFDKRLYRLLNRTLSRLPPAKIVDLSRYRRSLTAPR
jgi:DNA polymerase-3 subunit epsilon